MILLGQNKLTCGYKELIILIYYMPYTFTNGWFNVSELKRLMTQHLNPSCSHKILEIGCYEGASTCFFSDNVLDMPESELICVDPFETGDKTTQLNNNTKIVFYNNIKQSKNYNKISVNEMYSNVFFATNIKKYSFIYIDGSHELEDIKNDFLNALKIIEKGGIIWMDDYLGGPVNNDDIKRVIDSVYEDNKDKLSIIHKGYQIAFLYN
jgi:predicted O-methyltransferase YrrM